MSAPLSRSARCNHVVFHDPVSGRAPAINFAVRKSGSALHAPEKGSDADFFVRWVLGEAGLDPRHYKLETLRRRLPACLRALRAATTGEARVLLRRDEGLRQPALDALLLGVTSFFRDAAVFSAIERKVLPELLAGRDPPRICSVGCSDGAELYSVALLLAEAGPARGWKLLGIDCRPQALVRAADGVFSPSELHSVPAALREKYFTRAGGLTRSLPWLRGALQWRLADAFANTETAEWDLILCRNLAIYLEPPAVSRLWETLARALRPGGYLVVGKAERPRLAQLAAISSCIYRRERSH